MHMAKTCIQPGRIAASVLVRVKAANHVQERGGEGKGKGWKEGGMEGQLFFKPIEIPGIGTLKQILAQKREMAQLRATTVRSSLSEPPPIVGRWMQSEIQRAIKRARGTETSPFIRIFMQVSVAMDICCVLLRIFTHSGPPLLHPPLCFSFFVLLRFCFLRNTAGRIWQGIEVF